MVTKKKITLKTLTKGNVWTLQENDVIRLLSSANKDPELKDNFMHYVDIFKTAFNVEQIPVDNSEVIKKFENRGMKVAPITIGESKKKWAIKKRAITKVTDLTYENIHYLTATQLLAVLESNFGGGWESLSQSVRDIIESGFDVSTTTLPTSRLRRKGGMYENKIADDFEVLEIEKGGWTEAIFVKQKPNPVSETIVHEDVEPRSAFLDDESDEDLPDIDDSDYEHDEFEDEYDEDKMLEESYRTTIETSPDDLTLDEVISDEDYDDEG